MLEEKLQVYDYDGDGYKTMHSFDGWRIAYLNYAERFSKEGMTYLERHNLTDEAFILLNGDATLLIGEKGEPCKMEKNKIYNVQKGVWHNIIVSRDAKCLVFENLDTSAENTEFLYLK